LAFQRFSAYGLEDVMERGGWGQLVGLRMTNGTRPRAKRDIPNTDRAFGSFGSGNITFELLNRLGQEIVAGRIGVTDSFPNEGALSSELQISRTAVREAIKMLTAKGLVGSRPRRGIDVRPVSDWNLLDSDVLRWLRESPPDHKIVIELLELRLGFEPEAASLAARRADPVQLARIEEAYGAMRESAEGRYDPVEADCRFHEAIIVATSNRFYQPLGALVRTALSLTAPITNAIFGHSVGDLGAHGEILLAIKAKDERRAFDRMRWMLSDVAKEVAETETLPQAARTLTGRPAR
jgi:DNA-binding FadR family transcriptional regulator